MEARRMLPLFVALLFLLSGCFVNLNPHSPKEKKVTLRILGDVNRIFDPKAEGLGTLRDFERQWPGIKVKPIIEYDEARIYRIARERLSDPHKAFRGPDIIEVPGSWVAEFARDGLILPIGDWFKSLPRKEQHDFYPPLLTSYTYEGELYGLPALVGVQLLYGRKDLLPSGKLPKTIDELVFMAEEIQKEKKVRGFIFPSIGSALKEFYLTLFKIYLQDQGGDETARREAHIKAYRTLATLVYKYQKEYRKYDYAVAEGEFRSGKVAFSINGNYVWYLLSRSKKVGFPIGQEEVVTRFLPCARKDGARRNFIWTRGYVINAHTRYPKEAKKLLRFLCSTEASFWRLRERYILPTRRTVAVYGAHLPAMAPPPVQALYAKRESLGGVGKISRPSPRWHEVSQAMTILLQKALDNSFSAEAFADQMIEIEKKYH